MEKNLTTRDKLARFIVAKGYPARKDEDWYYGAIAERHQEVRDHMSICSVLRYDKLNDRNHWYAFQGTFVDDREKLAMTVTITCGCGKVKAQPFIYEAGPGETIIEFITYAEEQDW